MRPVWGWVVEHDRGYAALRRAGRSAVVMPALFALGERVLRDPLVGTFAAFGSFALLLLVDFTGPMLDRLQAQLALCVVGALFVVLGTIVSQIAWLAVATMLLVALGTLFCGVISSVFAASTTALLLAVILPITFAGPPSSIPARLAGWGLASAASLLAIGLLWPAPTRDALRGDAILACRAMAERLRADVAYLLAGPDAPSAAAHEVLIARTDAAVDQLQRTFLATPYRPTGLGAAARSVVRLVDEVRWLHAIISKSAPRPTGVSANPIACPVRLAAAAVLERGADLLVTPRASDEELQHSLDALRVALFAMERRAMVEFPIAQFAAPRESSEPPEAVGEFITALDPSFRAQELTFAVAQIGANVALSAAAEQRSWIDRLLGRQPEGLPGTLGAAQQRAASHVERHSVWLHNSLRGAVALAASVLVAHLSGVGHSFWVVLGTLSVLRSNALNTGQNVARGILGTVAGFVVGGALIELIGTDTTVLWLLLPLAILFAGFAPAAISFAAGQAAFTVALVILYNIIQPAGWQIGLLRIEDIALGCAVSLGVGLLFWPRGAAVALGTALSEAYEESAHYLARAVEFGMGRCDRATPEVPPPAAEALRAAAASRRLDDTFRGYLAERGSKPLPLAAVTSLVTGPAALRLAGDAVLDLWQRDHAEQGDRAGARREIVASSELVAGWYDEFAASLAAARPAPAPLTKDPIADDRLLGAVGHDLQSKDGKATSTAVRMIWTSDHLDAARRLQVMLVGPAKTAGAAHALSSRPLWRRDPGAALAGTEGAPSP